TAAAKKRTKLSPLCNYPGEGFLHITKAEWERIHSDYKSTRIIEANATHKAHRVRYQWGTRGGYYFLTDVKVSPPPAAEPVQPAPEPMPQHLRVELEPEDLVTDTKAILPEKRTERTVFDGFKDALKTGVQVVTGPDLFPTPNELADRM